MDDLKRRFIKESFMEPEGLSSNESQLSDDDSEDELERAPETANRSSAASQALPSPSTGKRKEIDILPAGPKAKKHAASPQNK